MPEIRPETAADAAGIRNVHLQAFEGNGEADLVDALRAHDNLLISFVALDGDRVVGHVAYSPIEIGETGEKDGREDERVEHRFSALALAPIAVLPEFQRRSIGTELMEASLRECERRGVRVVVVLGDPAYYERFGFVPAARYGIRPPFDVEERYYMLRAVGDADVNGMNGAVRYVPEFDGLE